MEGPVTAPDLAVNVAEDDLDSSDDVSDDDDRDRNLHTLGYHSRLGCVRLSRASEHGGRPTRKRVPIQHTSLKSSLVTPNPLSILQII